MNVCMLAVTRALILEPTKRAAADYFAHSPLRNTGTRRPSA